MKSEKRFVLFWDPHVKAWNVLYCTREHAARVLNKRAQWNDIRFGSTRLFKAVDAGHMVRFWMHRNPTRELAVQHAVFEFLKENPEEFAQFVGISVANLAVNEFKVDPYKAFSIYHQIFNEERINQIPKAARAPIWADLDRG